MNPKRSTPASRLINELVQQRMLSPAELAENVGVTPAAIRKLRRGDQPSASDTAIIKLAMLAGRTPQEIRDAVLLNVAERVEQEYRTVLLSEPCADASASVCSRHAIHRLDFETIVQCRVRAEGRAACSDALYATADLVSISPGLNLRAGCIAVLVRDPDGRQVVYEVDPSGTPGSPGQLCLLQPAGRDPSLATFLSQLPGTRTMAFALQQQLHVTVPLVDQQAPGSTGWELVGVILRIAHADLPAPRTA